MATAGTDSNLGYQKKEEGVNNNEEETQDIQGTDPNLGYQKKKAAVNNNSKGEKIDDEKFEEIPELALQRLTHRSESGDSESSENSDECETVSGSSQNLSDSQSSVNSEDMVENNNEKKPLEVAEGLIKDFCDISLKNKLRYIFNSMKDKSGENDVTPLTMDVVVEHRIKLIEELLRHPDVDFQTFKEIKHYPLDFHIEAIDELARIYDSEEFESILYIMSLDDENAIVFQGTLLHQAVSQGSFELVKALIPHFKDPNPEAEPGTPYECMTPLNLAAFEGNKEIYNFLIEKIGQENLEEIPHLVDHRLACGSGFENPKGSENSDDSKTGSGSSENSSD